MTRYVIVSTDPADKVIRDGPLLWDGAVGGLALPADELPMTEAAAMSGGYTYPPAPLADRNATTLRQRAAAAIASNATYLAIPTPTNQQVAAQIAALTRQINALIRLALNATNDISGT